jgi:hypothetical protein
MRTGAESRLPGLETAGFEHPTTFEFFDLRQTFGGLECRIQKFFVTPVQHQLR